MARLSLQEVCNLLSKDRTARVAVLRTSIEEFLPLRKSPVFYFWRDIDQAPPELIVGGVAYRIRAVLYHNAPTAAQHSWLERLQESYDLFICEAKSPASLSQALQIMQGYACQDILTGPQLQPMQDAAKVKSLMIDQLSPGEARSRISRDAMREVVEFVKQEGVFAFGITAAEAVRQLVGAAEYRNLGYNANNLKAIYYQLRLVRGFAEKGTKQDLALQLVRTQGKFGAGVNPRGEITRLLRIARLEGVDTTSSALDVAYFGVLIEEGLYP